MVIHPGGKVEMSNDRLGQLEVQCWTEDCCRLARSSATSVRQVTLGLLSSKSSPPTMTARRSNRFSPKPNSGSKPAQLADRSAGPLSATVHVDHCPRQIVDLMGTEHSSKHADFLWPFQSSERQASFVQRFLPPRFIAKANLGPCL